MSIPSDQLAERLSKDSDLVDGTQYLDNMLHFGSITQGINATLSMCIVISICLGGNALNAGLMGCCLLCCNNIAVFVQQVMALQAAFGTVGTLCGGPSSQLKEHKVEINHINARMVLMWVPIAQLSLLLLLIICFAV